MLHRNVVAGTPVDLKERSSGSAACRTGLEPAPDEVEERAVRSGAGVVEMKAGLLTSR
jgi:hypothetical protein